MNMTRPPKLPFISPPIIFYLELLLQYMSKEQLPSFLKPICGDRRILVQVETEKFDSFLFSRIWSNMTWHKSMEIFPLNIRSRGCSKKVGASNVLYHCLQFSTS